MKESIDWSKFFLVLILTVAVFVIGVFFGNYITEIKYDTIFNTEQSLRLELLGLDTQYSLIESDPCKVFNDTSLSESLDEMGNKVTYLENTLGTSSEEVINLKKYYFLLEIRHYLLKQRAVKECDVQHDFILYFYSNKGYCKDCKQEGFVISNIRENFDNLSSYSFDIDAENPALDTLKSINDVGNVAPVVVVNGETYAGFKSKEFIENKLESSKN